MYRLVKAASTHWRHRWGRQERHRSRDQPAGRWRRRPCWASPGNDSPSPCRSVNVITQRMIQDAIPTEESRRDARLHFLCHSARGQIYHTLRRMASATSDLRLPSRPNSAATAFWPVLASYLVEGRRLGWPGCLVIPVLCICRSVYRGAIRRGHRWVSDAIYGPRRLRVDDNDDDSVPANDHPPQY